MSKSKTNGLIVEVGTNEYNCYGNPGSYRHSLLMALMKRMGGISNTVAPGTYIFNIKREGFGVAVTLLPKK